ncbi:MAG: helix-turn-helix transcriptional regulator [Myxococcaceae bacterium]|nr:helix-turn-helix transcriptional regulator [Myxococcaceae bacterium]
MTTPASTRKKAFPNIFGRNLLRFRHARGWTQRELAMRANLSRITIEGIERGARVNPDSRTVYLLAEALQVQPGDLWNISDTLPNSLLPPPLYVSKEISPEQFIESEREELTGHEYRLISMLSEHTTVLKSAPKDDWYKFIKILRKELPPRF